MELAAQLHLQLQQLWCVLRPEADLDGAALEASHAGCLQPLQCLAAREEGPGVLHEELAEVLQPGTLYRAKDAPGCRTAHDGRSGRTSSRSRAYSSYWTCSASWNFSRSGRLERSMHG